MALVTCPDCSTQVSDQAPACPRCGRPLHGNAGAWQPQQASPNKGMAIGLIIAIVAAVAIVPIIGIVAVLSIYGTRKYLVNAKSAEAKNTLGQLAKDAAAAYEGDTVASDGTVKRRLCPSATAPVPADKSMVSGKKYQSSHADWQAGEAANTGFACLKFEMSSPQYFQYEYEATATSFVARAHGDLNGDGVFSTYAIRGQIVDGRVVIAPSIEETNPQE